MERWTIKYEGLLLINSKNKYCEENMNQNKQKKVLSILPFQIGCHISTKFLMFLECLETNS